MVFNIEKSEIFYDAIREKNSYRKLLDTNPTNDYQIFLRTIMDKADLNNEVRKGERENPINIYSADDCSNEDDPQCALFLRSLKSRGQSYVLETNKNGAPLIIEYEVESSSQEESEAVRRKKTCSGVDQIRTSKRDKVEKVVKGKGVCSEYRNQVLNEMRKPYSKEEYNKLKALNTMLKFESQLSVIWTYAMGEKDHIHSINMGSFFLITIPIFCESSMKSKVIEGKA